MDMFLTGVCLRGTLVIQSGRKQQNTPKRWGEDERETLQEHPPPKTHQNKDPGGENVQYLLKYKLGQP